MQTKYGSYQIRINGIVQGVGFRPFVYRLASEYDLKGWVLNSSAGVLIRVEGPDEQINTFARRLVEEPPPLALIRSWDINAQDWSGFTDFKIKASDDHEQKVAMISPDIAVCAECRSEVLNREDRRYHYPFINCTNCGPRFTIIKDLPYDRSMTTMASFPMCPECQREYENPNHRRFHAQPNACPVCGPHISLLNRQGQEINQDVRELFKAGYIVAVKGLGGFHLAVNARDAKAVARLRKSKQRDAKPFAVMVKDVETAHKYCLISPPEERWLLAPQAPIVVLKCREGNQLNSDIIHPGLNTLGVMLPYTPLHYLLFDQDLEILIMTSANISDEPLIIDNQEAIGKLGQIADYFLVHNRDIYNPCDDSVLRVTSLETPLFFRRARGFVPRGIKIDDGTKPILAVGGEMKNTFCLTRNGEAFLSQHWGDLNHFNNYMNFQRGIERFKRMLYVEPEIIAHDLHPNYQTSRWAKMQPGVKLIEVQHHFAHLASVMAEHNLQGEVLGLICDGTGWGTDGAVWGGEILRADYTGFTRLAQHKYVPFPGGDQNAKKPYRMALIYLYAAFGEEVFDLAEQFLPQLATEEKNIMLTCLMNNAHVLRTSSCGRLFDAAGAILGICSINQYEGQAAAELEAWADPFEKGHYGFDLYAEQGIWQMDVLPMWPEMLAEIKRNYLPGRIAQKFHLTLVKMWTKTLCKLRDETGLNRVVLSGGVFCNQILSNGLYKSLTEEGFKVYLHQQVPPGDGGISLGQAIIASEVYRGCV